MTSEIQRHNTPLKRRYLCKHFVTDSRTVQHLHALHRNHGRRKSLNPARERFLFYFGEYSRSRSTVRVAHFGNWINAILTTLSCKYFNKIGTVSLNSSRLVVDFGICYMSVGLCNHIIQAKYFFDRTFSMLNYSVTSPTLTLSLIK